jgi:hypothetical protein
MDSTKDSSYGRLFAGEAHGAGEGAGTGSRFIDNERAKIFYKGKGERKSGCGATFFYTLITQRAMVTVCQ